MQKQRWRHIDSSIFSFKSFGALAVWPLLWVLVVVFCLVKRSACRRPSSLCVCVCVPSSVVVVCVCVCRRPLARARSIFFENRRGARALSLKICPPKMLQIATHPPTHPPTHASWTICRLSFCCWFPVFSMCSVCALSVVAQNIIIWQQKSREFLRKNCLQWRFTKIGKMENWHTLCIKKMTKRPYNQFWKLWDKQTTLKRCAASVVSDKMYKRQKKKTTCWLKWFKPNLLQIFWVCFFTTWMLVILLTT